MERRADECVQEADNAAGRAEETRADASSAAERAGASADTASNSQRHLAALTERLRADAAKLGADAAVERLLATARELTTARSGLTPTAGIDQLCGTPLAWAEARRTQIRAVQETLRGHAEAQQAEKSAAQDRRNADDEEDVRRDAADTAAEQRQEAERVLCEALVRWATTIQHLGPVPLEMTTPDEEAGQDRLDPDRLMVWLSESLNAARARIGLAHHEQAAVTDAALASAAATTSQTAREGHEKANEAAAEATNNYSSAVEQARAEAIIAEKQKTRARTSHEEGIASARGGLVSRFGDS